MRAIFMLAPPAASLLCSPAFYRTRQPCRQVDRVGWREQQLGEAVRATRTGTDAKLDRDGFEVRLHGHAYSHWQHAGDLGLEVGRMGVAGYARAASVV
jgi:hypothetical protein